MVPYIYSTPIPTSSHSHKSLNTATQLPYFPPTRRNIIHPHHNNTRSTHPPYPSIILNPAQTQPSGNRTPSPRTTKTVRGTPCPLRRQRKPAPTPASGTVKRQHSPRIINQVSSSANDSWLVCWLILWQTRKSTIR